MRAQIIEDEPIIGFVAGDRVIAHSFDDYKKKFDGMHGTITAIGIAIAHVKFDSIPDILSWRLELLTFEAGPVEIPDEYFS